MNERPIYVLSLSGGKDSTASLILAVENHEPLDCAVCVETMWDENTSGFDPEQREFIYGALTDYCKEHGVPFHIVRGKPYLELFHKVISHGKRKGMVRGFMGHSGRFCMLTNDKQRAVKAFRKAQFGKAPTVDYVGIAIDEPRRLDLMHKRGSVSLLEKYDMTEADAMELCRNRNLLSPIYEFATRDGCWFCHNRRREAFERFAKVHPELFRQLLALDTIDKDTMATKWFRSDCKPMLEGRFKGIEIDNNN